MPYTFQIRHTLSAATVLLASVAAPACSVTTPEEITAAEALTQAISFGSSARLVRGKLPEGEDTDVEITSDEEAEPPVFQADERVIVSVPWQGGSISAVNISFGGSSYFQAKASSKAATGNLQLVGNLSDNACSQLASTCHMIKCYEQVVLPDGKTVSKAAAMQVVLDCTGGKGCGGSGPGVAVLPAPEGGTATVTTPQGGMVGIVIPDAGRADAGITVVVDASVRDAAAPVTCGGKTCSSFVTALGVSAAGCATNARDAEVCGLSTASLFGDAGAPPFLEKAAPGVASPTCGALIDGLDTFADGGAVPPNTPPRGNMQLDRFTSLSGILLQQSIPGCCTASGVCSGDSNNVSTNLGASSNGFGCMEPRWFLRSAPPAFQAVACDPITGIRTVVPADGGTDAGDAGL